MQVDTGLGRRRQTQFGQADHHHPGAGTGRPRRQVQSEGGGSGPTDGHRGAPSEDTVRQQRLQGLDEGKGSLSGQGDRTGPVDHLAQLGRDDHRTSIEHTFAARNRFIRGGADR